VHTDVGYASDKMIVIPNGFDLNSFKPDREARLSVRGELGIPEDAFIIGSVARFDPQKDHGNFIKAAAILRADVPNVNFVLCGDGIIYDNAELTQWIDTKGLREHVHLLGRREDIPGVINALDIVSSTSFSEGFSNAVGEAMACGVPCVVTDVGDSAFIVGDTGRVVPPKDPAALALAWRDLIEMDEEARRRLGDEARRRIEKSFNLPIITRRYEDLYRDMSL
jgi:glycosyltransferase involved in cell wall biosynthesis